MPRLALVFGTRPEAIKVAPVALAARESDAWQVTLVHSGQHRELIEPVLEFFGLRPDARLDLMEGSPPLPELTARGIERIAAALRAARPDIVLVQGDTTTALAGAMAAFLLRIPVGHIEAGLRTDRLDSPFPEEFHRRAIDQCSTWLFPPTIAAEQRLRAEGLDRPGVTMLTTGNTGIDALRRAVARIEATPPRSSELDAVAAWKGRSPAHRMILVTAHRRENFGEPMRAIATAIEGLATRHDEALFVLALHRNEQARGPFLELLGGRPNVRLVEALDYPEFVAMMRAADIILSDSGGIQEEAPALGRPLLVTRPVTERPETIDADGGVLVGCQPALIAREVTRLLTDPVEYARRAAVRSLYGDGHASERLLECLLASWPVPASTAGA